MNPELTKLLRKKCATFGKDFKAGRIKEMIDRFYHPEAVMEGRDLPAQEGREAICRIFEEALDVYSSLTIELEDVKLIGDVAFGNFTNRNAIIGGGEDIHRGLLIWRKDGDEWLAVRDFFFAEGDPLFNSIPLYPSAGQVTPPRRSRRA